MTPEAWGVIALLLLLGAAAGAVWLLLFWGEDAHLLDDLKDPSMLNEKQLLTLVIRPVHDSLRMGGPAADVLVLGTFLTESRLEYIKQVGGGPALGLGQMEPATFNDHLEHFIKPKGLLPSVRRWSIGEPTPDQLPGNLYLAVAMTRLHYRRRPEPLPAADDAMGMAMYWKQHYNSPLGAGDPAKAVIHFERAIAIVRAAG